MGGAEKALGRNELGIDSYMYERLDSAKGAKAYQGKHTVQSKVVFINIAHWLEKQRGHFQSETLK